MGIQVGNKFTWVIKNFYHLPKIIFSDQFVIGGCKWHLKAFPKGNNKTHDLSLYLMVADAENLPSGWKRHAKISFTIVNQISDKLSKVLETQHWFNHKESDWGFTSMFPLSKLKAGGFMVNGEVKIVAEVEVLEVTGKLDVPEESEEAIQPLKQRKMNDDGAVSSDLPKEIPADWVDVNGFQVLPSQVKVVSRIFEKYPDIALQVRAKNHYLRTACMNVLLSLIETLCQSPQELSNEDLVEADNALAYVKDAGFKVDWLEKKLEVVKEKKEEEQTGEIRIQQFEEELKDFKHKCFALEALLEIEKARVLAARAHLTLDDFV